MKVSNLKIMSKLLYFEGQTCTMKHGLVLSGLFLYQWSDLPGLVSLVWRHWSAFIGLVSLVCSYVDTTLSGLVLSHWCRLM